jgi:ribose/xylose/arabinose/galactoside ABC-type transport system permease subunit
MAETEKITVNKRLLTTIILKKPRLHRDFVVRFVPLIVAGLVIALIAFIIPNSLSTRNVVNVLMQSSALGLMAIGITVVLILGGIDLSIPAVMALSGVIGAVFMREGGNPLLAAALMIFVGIFCGSINGLAVAYLRMIPFVVTLSMMAIATGTSILISSQVAVRVANPSFTNVVLAKVGLIPIPVIIVILITGIVWLLMDRSLFGRSLYAIGTNARAARVSGINTSRYIFGSYVFSGFFAGLAGIVVTARLGSATAQMGAESVVLDVISSAVVGGASIYGGKGTALGAVIGALFITFISNSMNLLHVTYFWTLIIKGLIIIMVVALDSLRK